MKGACIDSEPTITHNPPTDLSQFQSLFGRGVQAESCQLSSLINNYDDLIGCLTIPSVRVQSDRNRTSRSAELALHRTLSIHLLAQRSLDK